MAAPPLSDLDSLLASLNQLKPPGASKGKIASITSLCLNNIQAESSIVQSLYRAFKKAPPTHKLGTLYVIDSVVRQWIDAAKKQGQDLNIEGRGEPGTFPAAVKRVTELMPALIDDIMKALPEEQRPKLENVVTIWERGHTFPSKLLADFKSKLSGQRSAASASTTVNGSATASKQVHTEKFKAPVPSRPLLTPLGLPPDRLFDQGFIPTTASQSTQNGINGSHSRQAPAQQAPSQPPASAPTQNVNDILASLANLVPQAQAPPPQHVQQQPPPPASHPPQQALPAGLPPEIAAMFGQAMQQNGTQQYQQPPPVPMPFQTQQAAGPPAQPAYHMPPSYPGYAPNPPPSVPQQYNVAPPPPQAPPAADPLGPLRGILPPSILNDQAKLMQALALLQDLQKEGVPMDQWGPVIEAFNTQTQGQAAPEADRYSGYGGTDRGRGRSRSPDRSAGRRRASPVYGTYEEIQMKKQAEDERLGRAGGRRYRQRSPMGSPVNRGYGSPAQLAMNGAPMQPKFIGLDNSLPRDHIKVLSRTLFVGGANGTQAEIEQLFSRFGKVQTCIANRDKRHAFVKMTTRQHALSAKEGMEHLQAINDRETMNIARQTKWGVGFGPRECCDYSKGESIIPIPKLTEADMKWLLTAEYGGTGGKPIEGAMVLEEPDIEIGAGVSSKAMSKRVLPDSGPPAKKGPDRGSKRGRYGGGAKDDAVAYGYGGGGGGAGMMQQQHQQPMQMESYGYARPEPVAVATPPAVPGFGFSFAPR